MPENPGSRQVSRVLVTPLVTDILFYELVKTVDRVNPKGTTFPHAYGATYASLHANSILYPNHTLAHVEDADEQGLQQRWWYCADRATQETYNGSISYPYNGNIRYMRITREYILPRAEGEVPLELGTADPGTQSNITYTIVQPDGSAILQPSPSTDGLIYDTGVTAAVLVAQSEEPIPVDSHIGSLYVKVTRLFDVLPGGDDVVPGSGEGQVDAGYLVERPLGIESFFRLTWKLTLPRTVADNYKTAGYAPCPIPKYTSLQLIQETIKADEGTNQTSTLTRIYEGNIIGAAFPSADHVYYQGNFLPSNMPPDKFIVRKRKVIKTNLTASTQSQNVFSPAASPESSADPNLYDRLESVEAKPSTNSPVLTGTKELTYYTDIVLRYINGEQWDDNIRDYVPYQVFVFPLDNYVAGDLGEPVAGTVRDVTPLGTGWVMVTIQTPRVTEIENLVNPFTDLGTSARNYFDYRVKPWPNVLSSLTLNTSPTGETALDYEFKPRAWNGPCLCCIQVAWQITSPLVNTNPLYRVQFLDPTSLRIQWPGQLNASIPECLHYNPDPDVVTAGYPAGAFVFTSTIYPFKVWEATNFHEWPDHYVEQIHVVPYLGGWWITKIWVQKPSVGNVSS